MLHVQWFQIFHNRWNLSRELSLFQYIRSDPEYRLQIELSESIDLCLNCQNCIAVVKNRSTNVKRDINSNFPHVNTNTIQHAPKRSEIKAAISLKQMHALAGVFYCTICGHGTSQKVLYRVRFSWWVMLNIYTTYPIKLVHLESDVLWIFITNHNKIYHYVVFARWSFGILAIFSTKFFIHSITRFNRWLWNLFLTCLNPIKQRLEEFRSIA